MNIEETIQKLSPTAREMVAEWPAGEGALLIAEVAEGTSIVIPMPRAELLAIMIEGLALCAPDEPASALDMLRHPPMGGVPWVVSTADGRTCVGLIIPKIATVRGGDA